ncbi:uncharacterized protein LOC115920519 [Strongylocentrotus purpuratus]|uniref:Uncharacterized protein n=1 Tax=Strongylocentrotus purpuratus TaxID=7668 RepID=A0A7M7NA70_STRPU|nr:uncharacterized protein LOC115920519 [Strongylocentrotus purpuratus]
MCTRTRYLKGESFQIDMIQDHSSNRVLSSGNRPENVQLSMQSDSSSILVTTLSLQKDFASFSSSPEAGNDEHHNHEISKKEDIVKDVKKRVHHLSAQCEERKATIVKEINICEEHRLELDSSARVVQKEISDAFDKKAAFVPREKRTRLLKRAKSLQEFQNRKLDSDVAKHAQAIKEIDERFSELENLSKMLKDGSTITICNVLSSDLEELLTQEARLQDTTEAFEETVKRLQFIPASKGVPALGTVRLRQEERLLRRSDSPDTTGNSSFTLTVIRVISLSRSVQGMTAISEDKVLVGYGSNKDGSECVCVSGKSEQHLPTTVGEVCDIATLTDGRSVVSQQSHTLRLFNPDGSPTGVHYTCKNGPYFLRICSDKDDNLYAVNGNPEIYIFRAKDPDPDESVIPTGDIKPEQICVMKSGAMVVTTRGSKPGAVTLLDTSGHVITSITANHSHEHLYAAVDSLDRVFIAKNDVYLLVYILNEEVDLEYNNPENMQTRRLLKLMPHSPDCMVKITKALVRIHVASSQLVPGSDRGASPVKFP